MHLIKILLTKFTLVFALLATLSTAWAEKGIRQKYELIDVSRVQSHSQTIEKGEIYRVKIAELRPTQFAVGMDEVRSRARVIKDKTGKALREYLESKLPKMIVGPGPEGEGLALWLIDGHHLTLAVDQTGRKEMIAQIAHEWSDLSRDDFYNRLRDRQYVWLYDETGHGPRSIKELPNRVSDLAQHDDPYRSLAWRVRKAGAFKKTDIPFAEFMWGNYFRNEIPTDLLESDPDVALKRAVELAHGSRAQGLPGYSPKSARCALEWLEGVIDQNTP